MVGSSDGIRRLLAVIAIGCAIGGILLASSAMPMLAGDTPAASVLGDEGVAAEHEQAVQQALLGSALEHGDGDESIDESALEDIDGSDIDDGDIDPEELERAIEEGDIDPEEVERAIEEGDIDPEALEDGFEDGDSSDLQLGGGSLPAGAMAGGDGGLEGDVTRAAVLTAMELQGDQLTDPQMSDALFGLGAVYAAMGGSTDGLPANADLDAEGSHDDGMTADGLGAGDTSSGGVLDVPTSSSGLDGGFGDAVGEQEDVVTEEGMDFDGTADDDGFDGDSDDADGFDADGSDGAESDGMDDGDDDETWDNDEEETTDDSEQHDEDSETDDGQATADEDDDTDGGHTTTDDRDDSSDEPSTDESDATDDSSTETEDSSADDDGAETDDDSAGTDDGDDTSDESSTDETDEGSSDDDSSDDEGFVASMTESLEPAGDRPLLTAVLTVVLVVVAYVFLTKDDPIATLRAIPGRLVSLVMGAVVACSQLLERAVSALARVKSIAEIPGLIVAALVGALASMRQKATDVRASLPIVGDSESDTDTAAIDAEVQSSARERIRGAFYWLESMSTVYPLSVATPTDVAHDVKAQGVPAEPVDTIADAFRDVEYGDRDPERRLEQTTEAEAALQAALEQSAGETDTTGGTAEPTGAGPTEDR